MRVFIDDTGAISDIKFRLNSIQTGFHWIIKPNEIGSLSGEIERANSAVIEFNDSREVDALIDMLQRFKESNNYYFGEWRMWG